MIVSKMVVTDFEMKAVKLTPSLTHLHTYIIYIHILSAASARMG